MSCSCQNKKVEEKDMFENISTSSLREMLHTCEGQEDFSTCILLRNEINKRLAEEVEFRLKHVEHA